MKPPLLLAPWALLLVAACGSASDSPGASSGAPAASDPAAVQVPTPAEEAAKAAQAISPANAEDELKRLEAELAGG